MVEEEKQTEEPKEKVKKGYSLIEVPTQMGLAIQTPSGKNVSGDELMVIIANDIREIKANTC